jgi:alpha-galactosidase
MGLSGFQRSIENYPQFITLQAARNKPMTIHPDLDNLFVDNPEKVTGLYDSQRITLMSLWIGASANLILGSDLTNLEELGRKLITNPESMAAADFCSRYPMQPRNPGTGRSEGKQLQALISGPSEEGEAVAILTNLGANRGNEGYWSWWRGVQDLEISLWDLGVEDNGEQCWIVRDVWEGDIGIVKRGGSLEARLDAGESRTLWFEDLLNNRGWLKKDASYNPQRA